MNSIAYEMGAVFLLAAMLMFGSAHGFIPRSLRNTGAPILIGVALLGFLIWRFGPDLYANARSNVAPWLTTSQPPRADPASAPAPSPAPHPAKPSAPRVEGIVIREVVSPPAEAAPALVEASKPVDTLAQEPHNDRGVKRAVKSVGHFLHIGRHKEQPQQ